MKRLHALVLLGWHFVLHLIKKTTFTYRPGGLKQIESNFSEDSLPILSPDQRDKLASWQSCIGCELCDRISPETPVAQKPFPISPSYLATAGIRDLSRLDHLAETARVISRHYDGDKLKSACPENIDIVAIAKFIEKQDPPNP